MSADGAWALSSDVDHGIAVYYRKTSKPWFSATLKHQLSTMVAPAMHVGELARSASLIKYVDIMLSLSLHDLQHRELSGSSERVIR